MLRHIVTIIVIKIIHYHKWRTYSVRQTCYRSCDNLRTKLKIFRKSGSWSTNFKCAEETARQSNNTNSTSKAIAAIVVNCSTLHRQTFSDASSDVTRHICGVQNSLSRMKTAAMMLNDANWRPWYTSWKKYNIIAKPSCFLKNNCNMHDTRQRYRRHTTTQFSDAGFWQGCVRGQHGRGQGQGQGHKILSSRSRPVLEEPHPWAFYREMLEQLHVCHVVCLSITLKFNALLPPLVLVY